MLHVTMDARDGFNGASCTKCCCEAVQMRPGETNLIVLNYAPWSVPFGGRGIVPTPELTITPDNSSCSSAPIDTFAPPSAQFTQATTPVNTAVNIDLTTNVAPIGNTFEYRLLPVSGPTRGTLTTPINGTPWIYTPAPGFEGYDHFWVEVKDAQGRRVVREQIIKVGAALLSMPFDFGKTGLVIDRSKIMIDQRMQTLEIPLYLAPNADCGSVDGCISYQVMVKQPADDCCRIFHHISCFDVRCKSC